MRRIYQSEAIHTDDNQFTPHERDTETTIQAVRSINASAWSRRLVPGWMRHRGISVRISTPTTEYPAGKPVPFRVTMKNVMPFPITLRTRSLLPWTWSVDGIREASHTASHDPDESGAFYFDRGERKQFTKQWHQMFRISKSEWEPVDPGEYVISARLNVENARQKSLHDETTVQVVPTV